jgi:uncharacterized protein YbbC (DUF1343 family)
MVRTHPIVISTLALVHASVCSFALACTATGPVRPGADMLVESQFHLVEGKRIGLITNHTALLSNGKHLADVLSGDKRTTLAVLFAPEHGIRGDAAAGATIQDGRDPATGVPVVSLYGRVNKPTPEMLKDVDVLLFDIQDVGARFYTYPSTMSLAMEAAAERGIPFVVLDRPNPIRGTWVEGFVREESLKSFIGMHPTPIVHGQTVGELARMFNEEGWLKDGVKANLTVVRMKGWKRSMWYDETGLQWVGPSPNIPSLQSAIVYPGTCLIEGTNVSEGRGTDRPFEYIGAPYIDGARLAEHLNRLQLPGVVFEPVEFTPREIPGVALKPKHEGLRCGGVFVRVTDRNAYEPVRAGVHLLAAIRSMYPDEFRWIASSIDRLAGTARLREEIDRGTDPDDIVKLWEKDVEGFVKLSSKYALHAE